MRSRALSSITMAMGMRQEKTTIPKNDSPRQCEPGRFMNVGDASMPTLSATFTTGAGARLVL